MVQHNQNQSLQGDRSKSLLYMLSGILFVLVLLEKSMGSATSPKLNLPSASDIPQVRDNATQKAHDLIASEPWKNGFSGFKNVSPNDSEIPVVDFDENSPGMKPAKKPEMDESWEEQARNEIDELIPDEEIPVMDTKKSRNIEHVNVYFIKFFGTDNKAQSRLVRVPRLVPTNTDPILYILAELKKGPRPEESSKGVLNAIPDTFSYSKNYKITDGILHLDLSGSFEYGGGPEIIRDRLDQLTHSLVGINDIRAIRFTIDRKKVTSLGGDGIPLPDVMGKRDRRITTL
ncbi:MAG: GerMN domain-containing protein [Leptospira sp.]|nr:GerMN domain-containing protein [Leptospira sp.]